MQAQAMNFGGNRGFGGPPQPQRQGGRRGNRGGGGNFRQGSRFDQPPQQNQNNQEGQRPNDNQANQPANKPQTPQQANKPPQQQNKTPQQQNKTPQQQNKPPQQAGQQKPLQGGPQAATPAKPDAPAQQGPGKPAQATPAKPDNKDKVDSATPEQKTPGQGIQQANQQNGPNVNGAASFGPKQGWQSVNKQGGFGQGGQGNKQGGFGQGGQGNKQGGFGQGGQGNKQGGFGQGGNKQGGFGQGGNKQDGFGQGGNKQGGFGQGGNKQDSFGQVLAEGQEELDAAAVAAAAAAMGLPTSFGGTGPASQDDFGGPGNKQGGFGQGGHGNKHEGGRGQHDGGRGQHDGGRGQHDGGRGNFRQHGNFGRDGGNFGRDGGNFGRDGGNFDQGGGHQGGNRSFGGKGGQGGYGQGGPRGQGMKRGPPDGKMREDHMLAMKLKELVGPILDLPPLDQSEVKFNGRSRLYIGNLTNDVTEEEILELFKPFGETAELFLNKEKLFGFIKMDYRVNAERAKRELDGKIRHGKSLRVRFAPHNSAIRVKNLPPFVSNELLHQAFQIFGNIERAYVKVDERGKTLGEGVVEYARKPCALAAIRNCTEKCFFLTSSLRPVIVENFEEPDEFDGYPEKNLPKKHPEFLRAREMGPRFSEPNSFEHEYGTRWKQLHELHRQKEEALKKELASEEEKLEAQMEYAKYEHETELLREQLRQRELDRERQKRSWEMIERAAEERREAERAALARQEEELSQRMRLQDDELRRRQQENTLFVQAQRLNTMLDHQEQGMFDQQQPMDGGFRDQFEMGRGYDEAQGRNWDGPRMDDFPSKRRRF